MLFSSLLAAIERGKTVDIVTVIDGPVDDYTGKMILLHEDGRIEGQFDECVSQQMVNKVQSLSWSQAETLSIADSSGGKYRFLWDRIVNKCNAIVFGGGHISQPLVQMLSLIDFAVTVIDDRPEFANKNRFPSADKVICESFHQSFKQLVIDPDTAVIIVTRGHRYDMDCLRATMSSQARYLGMIGSRKRIKEVLQLLQAEGAPDGLAQRLKAPIGLNIKGETPAEIAVSIVAEVIAVFRGSILGLSVNEQKGVL